MIDQYFVQLSYLPFSLNNTLSLTAHSQSWAPLFVCERVVNHDIKTNVLVELQIFFCLFENI